MFLVNGGHVKGVPVKKTDVCDTQQLQRLHLAGRLHGLFRPEQRDEVRKRIARMG
jgi:hypothetical protein